MMHRMQGEEAIDLAVDSWSSNRWKSEIMPAIAEHDVRRVCFIGRKV